MKPILGLLILAIFISCDNNHSDRNPYLLETNFRYPINLNYEIDLRYPGNAIHIKDATVGIRGAFVFYSGSSYLAWEASCPNHAPNDCSTMSLEGLIVTCSCEGYRYHLSNGQLLDRPDDGKRYHDLLFYQATLSGNTVIISN
ncbi:hypothetical protein KCTC52924_01660 [Arenibacter antarcticus]|uniref:Rieske (2Fe-2S) protein n=1 Tax=Arenibacter antarcticus TaxID=2040469 RepID=A0ABW5VH53_9FLAO|nr:hypothetical protein [Arenibacter sp. H213]